MIITVFGIQITTKICTPDIKSPCTNHQLPNIPYFSPEDKFHQNAAYAKILYNAAKWKVISVLTSTKAHCVLLHKTFQEDLICFTAM
jgi:hypothetical protein